MPKNRQGGFTIIEVLIVLAIAVTLIGMVFVALPGVQKSRRNNQARKDLRVISAAAVVAQQAYHEPLRLVTGNACSSCSCRPPANLDDTACITDWQKALNKISSGGLDIGNLTEDPWGNPYLLDENEGENGTTDCRQDTIRTAGDDNTYNTADDITLSIPLKYAGCPPTI